MLLNIFEATNEGLIFLSLRDFRLRYYGGQDGWQDISFYYVYILRSESYPKQSYVGMTEDLKARLSVHNAGGSPHTSKYKPWAIETAIAFTSREKATAFEAYLKTGSGHEFRYRHF